MDGCGSSHILTHALSTTKMAARLVCTHHTHEDILGPAIHRAMEGWEGGFKTHEGHEHIVPSRRNGKGSGWCHCRHRKEHEEHPERHIWLLRRRES